MKASSTTPQQQKVSLSLSLLHYDARLIAAAATVDKGAATGSAWTLMGTKEGDNSGTSVASKDNNERHACSASP
eukprot:7683496-Ditylum_brightwellii.AAC.1